MQKELVFYTNPQSRASIVHWMLEELGVPYRPVVLTYGGTMKSPEYLALNPMGKVPAIQHGDKVVTEGAAICAYLADAFPETGLAPAPADRADYYRWLFFTSSCLEAASTNKAVGWIPNAEQQRFFGYGSFEHTVDALVKAVSGKRYIAGERFSAADVYVGRSIGYGIEFGALGSRPELVTYWNGLKDRPALARVAAQCEAWMKG
ncbi:MAG TPA: glutathione S-transferase family protein [Bordetella sp.]|uniref:glutathione S-transferase family protein n=1 Tax=Bordetella sp. TaxID=28081 RepID=UPI002ED390B1